MASEAQATHLLASHRTRPGGSRQKVEDLLEQRPGQELLTEQVVKVESRSRLQRSPLPARGTLSLVRPQQLDFTSSAIMPAPLWGVADVGLPSLAQGTLIAIVPGPVRRGHCCCSCAEIPADAGPGPVCTHNAFFPPVPPPRCFFSPAQAT